MKNLARMALLTAVVAISACGSDASTHVFQSGNYTITNFTPGNDGCDFGKDAANGQLLVIAVSGNDVTMKLSGDTNSATGTVSDDVINAKAPAVLVDYSNLVAACTTRMAREFDGTVTGDNTVSITLTMTATSTTGACGDYFHDCTSTFTFGATAPVAAQ